MITSILFDLNDVLVHYDNNLMNAQFIKEFGIDIKTFWDARHQNYLMRDYCLGKIDYDEFLSKILELNDIRSDRLANDKELHEKNIFLVKDIEILLADLKKYYRLVLVAGDGEASLNLKLDKFYLRKYFDAIYCTCFEGLLKSDPGFYKKVLEKEWLKAEECLFIDDQERFTIIAEGLGMKVMIFHDVGTLRAELKKKSIL